MKSITCLLIDDDAEEAEIFHYALEELNRPVKCITARSGTEAITILGNKQLTIDCVFLDMNMPRMNGFETLRQLRKLPALKDVPIVLYSSSFLDEQKNVLRTLGASGFLIKTGSVFDLQSRLFRIFAENDIRKVTVV